MKADELYRQLNLFALLTHKHAQTASYRALALAPDHVRACGLFGRMERDVVLGLDAEIYVDCEDVLQLLRSLPGAEFTAHAADGALRWTCGAAKGHLALMGGEREPLDVPAPTFYGAAPEGTITGQFSEGLELGALSCGSAALRTQGLQGVQIGNNNGHAYARATDSTTFSSCCLGPAIDGEPPGTITLLPEAIGLLAALLKRDGEAMLTYDDSSVFCVTDRTRLLLHQVPPLRLEIAEILDQYSAADTRMPLFREAVAAFLKRAEALSETPGGALIEVSAEDGRTRLSFNETASSSEEYYLVEGGPKITVPPVRVEAHRLVKALAHAEDIVFDYAKNNVLILRGRDEFVFAIMGRRSH